MDERIEKLKERRQKLKERIVRDTATIVEIEQQIREREMILLRQTMDEENISIEDLKTYLKSLKKNDFPDSNDDSFVNSLE